MAAQIPLLHEEVSTPGGTGRRGGKHLPQGMRRPAFAFARSGTPKAGPSARHQVDARGCDLLECQGLEEYRRERRMAPTIRRLALSADERTAP